MVVEVASVERDVTHAGFDESTCQQGLFAPASAVTLPQRGRLFGNIKRLADTAGKHQIHRLSADGVHLPELLVAVDTAFQTVQLL